MHIHASPRRVASVVTYIVIAVVALASPLQAQTGSIVQWGLSPGVPPTSERLVAITTGWSHNLALREDGSLVQWGDTSEDQAVNAPAASERFVAVSAGLYHSLAIRMDGSLVQWGDTSRNQAVGAPAASERFIAIAAGGNHCVALRANGTRVQWGETANGQTGGAPSSSARFVSIAAGWYHTLALRADGSWVQWGQAVQGQSNGAPVASERFQAITAGGFHNVALRLDGSLVQWGQTSSGQGSGVPPAAERFMAISAGGLHSLAIRPDGALVQWGNAAQGQANNSPPPSERFVAIAAGRYHNLALRGSPTADRLRFVYQGVLEGEAAAATNLRFSLWTAPTGGQRWGAVVRSALPRGPGGIISTDLDFGLVNPLTAPWLEVEVAEDGTGDLVALSPRQRLSAAPVAMIAHRATSAQSVPWSGITGAPWVVGTGGAINYTGGSVGIGTSSPTQRLSVDPGGAGGMIIGGPDPGSGARTCLWMTVSALSGGYSVIQSISSSGTSYGNLILNPATGLVGIGTSSPSSTLTVNGSASKPGGGSWSVFSDARLKHDITPLEGCLDRLLALRGVSFIYDNPAAINELPGERIGMVAQEVERIFPDWVQTGPSGYKSLTFRGFEALTVEAMRELRAENADLRARLERLEQVMKR